MRYEFEYSVVGREYDTRTIEANSITEAEDKFYEWAKPLFDKDVDMRVETVETIEDEKVVV